MTILGKPDRLYIQYRRADGQGKSRLLTLYNVTVEAAETRLRGASWFASDAPGKDIRHHIYIQIRSPKGGASRSLTVCGTMDEVTKHLRDTYTDINA